MKKDNFKSMKRLILALFFTLTLSGCGGSLPDGFNDQLEEKSLSGVLSEQKSGDDYKGTHLLTKKNGEIVAVNSVFLNLYRDEYKGKYVKAKGVLNEKEGIFTITELEISDEDSDSSEDNAPEKQMIYKSSSFGVEFKYSSLLELKELGNRIVLTAENDDRVEILRSPFPYSPKINENGQSDTPLGAYFNATFQNIGTADNYLNKVGPDKLNALKISEIDNEQDIYLFRNNLIYHIAFIGKELSVNQENRLMFNDIVNSFRFIGMNQEGEEESDAENIEIPLSTIPLTEFQSLPYKFKASYPSSWYYSGSRGGSSGVLHTYSFAEEEVSDDNVLIKLEVLSSPSKFGEVVRSGGSNIYKSESGDLLTLEKEVGKYSFRVSGTKEYETLMYPIIASIEEIANDNI